MSSRDFPIFDTFDGAGMVDGSFNPDTMAYAPIPIIRIRPSSVFMGETVILDGSNSYDPKGEYLTYLWEIVKSPQGSTSSIVSPSSEQTIFTPDEPGIYTFRLTATNLTHSSSEVATLTAFIEISIDGNISVSSELVLNMEATASINSDLSLSSNLPASMVYEEDVDLDTGLESEILLNMELEGSFDRALNIGSNLSPHSILHPKVPLNVPVDSESVGEVLPTVYVSGVRTWSTNGIKRLGSDHHEEWILPEEGGATNYTSIEVLEDDGTISVYNDGDSRAVRYDKWGTPIWDRRIPRNASRDTWAADTLDMDMDTTYVYISGREFESTGHIVKVDADTGSFVDAATLSPQSTDHNVSISLSGGFIYAICRTNDWVKTFDADTMQEVDSLDLSYRPQALDTDENGNVYIFSNHGQELRAYDSNLDLLWQRDTLLPDSAQGSFTTHVDDQYVWAGSGSLRRYNRSDGDSSGHVTEFDGITIGEIVSIQSSVEDNRVVVLWRDEAVGAPYITRRQRSMLPGSHKVTTNLVDHIFDLSIPDTNSEYWRILNE